MIPGPVAVATVFAIALTIGAGAITAGFGSETAGAWVVPAAVVVAWESVFFFRRTGLNHPPDDPDALADEIGVANAVTLGRGLLYAGVAGFVLTGPLAGPWAWAPALLYGSGAALDAVDGALARRLGRQTVLGEKLDMGIDTLGFLVAPLAGVAWGRIPIWYLTLSVARYLFKLGRWRRGRRDLPVYDLPSSRVRRPLAGVQMAFIAVALAPVLPASVVAVIAGVVVVPSLAVFVRDYLVVAGHLGDSDDDAREPGGDGREDTGDEGPASASDVAGAGDD
ncbi:CDP-alcohol phosphatidyltransferase family protein [Halobaculum rubrum]|uniref:CDP-alcohol phosphatidyltransferase family protein n=1 Tax=Halobaculum rubrum TaxID=2872158 RepID=UPI001CA44AF7|nr:CDP-alcohol phosphatidyltransferase family protein [Halobaculum rubrum]QZY00061.1 CDP-alcohol phosphatidyltransferase family protein [Halobaculum rubrum]